MVRYKSYIASQRKMKVLRCVRLWMAFFTQKLMTIQFQRSCTSSVKLPKYKMFFSVFQRTAKIFIMDNWTEWLYYGKRKKECLASSSTQFVWRQIQTNLMLCNKQMCFLCIYSTLYISCHARVDVCIQVSGWTWFFSITYSRFHRYLQTLHALTYAYEIQLEYDILTF